MVILSLFLVVVFKCEETKGGNVCYKYNSG